MNKYESALADIRELTEEIELLLDESETTCNKRILNRIITRIGELGTDIFSVCDNI